MTTVYLLRHGALAADARQRFIGHDDWPLAPEGFAQAEALGGMLREHGIGAIYCSDLLRSRQTAEIIAHHTAVPVRIRRNLREIALGAWEGLPRREVAARFPEQYAARGADLANYRVPGGESFAECQSRVLAAWQAIIGEGAAHIAIVGHAGANRALLCALLDLPLAGLFSLDQDYGCVNVIEINGSRVSVTLPSGCCQEHHTNDERTKP